MTRVKACTKINALKTPQYGDVMTSSLNYRNILQYTVLLDDENYVILGKNNRNTQSTEKSDDLKVGHTIRPTLKSSIFLEIHCTGWLCPWFSTIRRFDDCFFDFINPPLAVEEWGLRGGHNKNTYMYHGYDCRRQSISKETIATEKKIVSLWKTNVIQQN